MKTIKTFKEHKLNEFFGGPIEDLMNPRVDKIIEFLMAYKEKINSPNSLVSRDETSQVEKMWALLNKVPLDAMAKDQRTANKVRGNGETISQRLKRSIENF